MSIKNTKCVSDSAWPVKITQVFDERRVHVENNSGFRYVHQESGVGGPEFIGCVRLNADCRDDPLLVQSGVLCFCEISGRGFGTGPFLGEHGLR